MAIYQDEVLVKRAYRKVKYTKEQLEELKNCFNPKTGPLYFMENFMYVQHPTKGRIKYSPYPFQIGLIDTYHNYTKSIAMCSRQSGKSTVAAGYLLWYAMFKDDSTVLIASYKFSSAAEIMDRVRYAYESMPDHVRAGVKSYNKRSIEFDNGSRIIVSTTTDNTGRGMSISLIYLDEMSFIAPNIAKELWTSLSPTLSTGGKCIITSTPNIDEDQFAEIWFGANQMVDKDGNETLVGRNGFRPFLATWEAVPGRDEEWARHQREELGDGRFEREHNCCNGATLITLQDENGKVFDISMKDLYNKCT